MLPKQRRIKIRSTYLWRHQFLPTTHGRAMCIYSHVVILGMSYVDLRICELLVTDDEMSMGAQAKHLLQVIIEKRDLEPIICHRDDSCYPKK